MKSGDLIKITNRKYVEVCKSHSTGFTHVIDKFEILIFINCKRIPGRSDGILACEMLHHELGNIKFYAHQGELVVLS
jgi:hypothetical protein